MPPQLLTKQRPGLQPESAVFLRRWGDARRAGSLLRQGRPSRRTERQPVRHGSVVRRVARSALCSSRPSQTVRHKAESIAIPA
jgi:hypothetical protein